MWSQTRAVIEETPRRAHSRTHHAEVSRLLSRNSLSAPRRQAEMIMKVPAREAGLLPSLREEPPRNVPTGTHSGLRQPCRERSHHPERKRRRVPEVVFDLGPTGESPLDWGPGSSMRTSRLPDLPTATPPERRLYWSCAGFLFDICRERCYLLGPSGLPENSDMGRRCITLGQRAHGRAQRRLPIQG